MRKLLLAPRACVICGKIFQPDCDRRKTCGERFCVEANSRKYKPRDDSPRQCVVCGREFTPKTRRIVCCDDPACKAARLRERTRCWYYAHKTARTARASKPEPQGCDGAARIYDEGLGLELYACQRLSLKALRYPCESCEFHRKDF